MLTFIGDMSLKVPCSPIHDAGIPYDGQQVVRNPSYLKQHEGNFAGPSRFFIEITLGWEGQPAEHH